MVSPHDSLEVEVLGGDQAQLQAQQEQCHALWWVPALRPAPSIPLPALWFLATVFRVLRTGRCLLGTRPKAAAATPASHSVLPQRQLALESARMGVRLGLKLQREVGTGKRLGLKPHRLQRRVTLGPLGAVGRGQQRTLPLEGSLLPLPARPGLGAPI